MRRFYITIAIPHMLYATDLFLTTQTDRTKGTKGFINRLGQVKCQAALHATGALRTAPMDSLDAHADLLPFPLLVEKLLHRVATRIATLPKTHPLATHANKAARKYVKRHRAPLHELLHSNKIDPNEYEVIRPIRPSPKQSPRYSIQIPADRNLVPEKLMKFNQETKVYSNGSCIDGKVGAAAVMFKKGEEQ